MRFVRLIPWLKNCFPPSESPAREPSILSDDVQLIHDYWGGGYAQREPETWFSLATIGKVADYSWVFLSDMPAGETIRIVGCTVYRSAAGNQLVDLVGSLKVWAPSYTGQVNITDEQVIIPAGAPIGFGRRLHLPYPTLVPGGSHLAAAFITGDNVAYRWDFLACSVPRGVAIIA